jgi:G:T-mismatch repair DNA endonuclease (very short patch repair protein)
MSSFVCHICNNAYDTYTGISLHYRKTHGVSSTDVRKAVYNKGVTPICKCGCGEEVSWSNRRQSFNDFKHGHYVRTTGGFYSPDGAKKSGETRKRKFSTGELEQWNKGISFEQAYGKRRAKRMKHDLSTNTERSSKISKSLTGKKKSKEHIRKITEDRRRYWSDEENRLAQRERRMQYIIKNGFQIKSKLETKFAKILNEIGVEYYEQFYVSDIPALYDFKIKGKKILIEIDGDYWHCKPGTKFETPQYAAQFSNLESDEIKNEWAKSNGYTLLRFWETDIQENRLTVVKTLLENLS